MSMFLGAQHVEGHLMRGPICQALVAVAFVITDHVFPAVGDVRGKLGQPIRGRNILHPFLRNPSG